MHKFLVKNQKIETLERDVIASDQIAFVNIKFIFDGNWKTLHKVVQFTQCEETYNRVLGNDGTSCLLPTELHAGTVKMSVFGYDAENTQGLRATTVPVTLHIRPSGFVGDDTPIPPTPDLYAQLLQKMEELIASSGGTVDLSDYATAEYVDNKAIQWNDRLTYEVQELMQLLMPLQNQSHIHENAEILDSITTERIAKWDNAGTPTGFVTQLDFDVFCENTKAELHKHAQQLHSHANKAVLDAITTDKVSSWNMATALASELSEELQSLADSTKYDIQVQNEKILHLENLLILMESQLEKTATITLFRADSEALTTYGKSVALVLNDGYHLLADFEATYPNFCSSANNYALSYNQADFNWDAVITTILLTEVALTANSKIAIRYQSGAAEDGKMYLVAKPTEIPDVPIGVYIYNQIKANNAISLNFKWLYADSDVTTLTSCDNITNGSYYLAFVGRSNNTHPLVKAIQILGG